MIRTLILLALLALLATACTTPTGGTIAIESDPIGGWWVIDLIDGTGRDRIILDIDGGRAWRGYEWRTLTVIDAPPLIALDIDGEVLVWRRDQEGGAGEAWRNSAQDAAAFDCGPTLDGCPGVSVP